MIPIITPHKNILVTEYALQIVFLSISRNEFSSLREMTNSTKTVPIVHFPTSKSPPELRTIVPFPPENHPCHPRDPPRCRGGEKRAPHRNGSGDPTSETGDSCKRLTLEHVPRNWEDLFEYKSRPVDLSDAVCEHPVIVCTLKAIRVRDG